VRKVNFKGVLTVLVVGFVAFCGSIVVKSITEFHLQGNNRKGAGRACILLQQTTISENRDNTTEPERKRQRLEAANFHKLEAVGGFEKSITLGSIDPKSGFKFHLELVSKAAAIHKATFSEFDDRDYKNPRPLEILTPVRGLDGHEILSMANREFIFVDHRLQLRLDELYWKSSGVVTAEDGSQKTVFEAVIKDSSGKQVVKLTKTYRVIRDSYLLDCQLTVENLTNVEQNVRFNLTGPTGIGREDARTDVRKVVSGFKDPQGRITSMRLSGKKLRKAKTLDDRRLMSPNANFLWVAVVNKYFAAILVPVPDEGKSFCDWVKDATGWFYNPDGDSKADSGDETIGAVLQTVSTILAPMDKDNSSRTYNFHLFLGPKDKSLFDKDALYRQLGFIETIDFMTCCCPASIIRPLAFGILAVMKWMYVFIRNYGVVIIILVFLVRLALHPLTKKSQVSMSKMSKLAPKAEEIRKKYAGNKTEMNKQMMQLYKEQGATPIMGMLPMMVQMPILIALWSAIYTGIELRGKPFLPFWITDLSAPDALLRFSTVVVPLLGWKINSLNLLPILMGVALYLQQALMPSQAASATSPQMAQQQKMMKIIFPVMLPLVLYNGPSGVNLYFMASTFAGVIEQYVIRKHIREKEQKEQAGLVSATSKTGGKAKKKKPKPFIKFM